MFKSDRPRTPSDQVARPRDPGELAGGFISQRLGPSKLSCSVALSTDELDRDPGLPERRVAKTKQKALGIVGGKPRRYKHPSMYFLTYTNRFLTQNPGGGVGKALAFFFGGRPAYLVARRDRPNWHHTILTTLSGGSLGSGVDEERSQLRELM